MKGVQEGAPPASAGFCMSRIQRRFLQAGKGDGIFTLPAVSPRTVAPGLSRAGRRREGARVFPDELAFDIVYALNDLAGYSAPLAVADSAMDPLSLALLGRGSAVCARPKLSVFIPHFEFSTTKPCGSFWVHRPASIPTMWPCRRCGTTTRGWTRCPLLAFGPCC